MKMTYSFRLLALFSSLSILLLITSCEEDPLNIPIEITTENVPLSTSFQQPSFPKFSDIPFEQAYPSAYRNFARQVQNIEQTSRNEYFLFSDLDVNNYIVNTSPEGTSFVWYLPATGSSSGLYYNLVIEKYPEGYDEPFILEYELSNDFNNLFNSGQASLDEFSGFVRKYLLEQVIGNRDLTFEFCYELIFGDNGGGHGSYNDGPGTTTTTSSSSSNEGTIGLGGGGFFACIVCVPCTCQGHPCGTGSCTCGEGATGSKWHYTMENCGPSYFVQNNDDPQINGEGRGVLEDCLKILLDHGVMPPGYESENEEEDCAISQLKFIDEYNFSLPGFKHKGVILEECCEANNYEDCAWGIISLQYLLEFSWDDYKNVLLPFLEENDLSIDDFGEDINELFDFLKEHGADFALIDSDDYDAIKFFNICPLKTFDFSKTGNAYTMLLEKNWQGVLTQDYDLFRYGPKNMCIVVNERDNDGNLLDKENVALLTAEAFEIARSIIGDEILNGETESPNAAAGRFVFEFRNALNARFLGNQTITPVAEGCLNVNVSRPYYNIFGVCLPTIHY